MEETTILYAKTTNIYSIYNKNEKNQFKYRCVEYKNPTNANKTSCQAYFTVINNIFIRDYNAIHNNHKLYFIEMERLKTRKYLKDEVEYSPNKYSINPKNKYNNMKVQHPEINIHFNSLKQTIRNYIANQRPSEPETFDQINWNHELFTDLSGQRLYVSHN